MNKRVFFLFSNAHYVPILGQHQSLIIEQRSKTQQARSTKEQTTQITKKNVAYWGLIYLKNV